MTLILETESHGGVESGFFGAFTQFARLGEYTFATRHLCELVQYFARNPKLHEAQILSYDLDKFWERQGDHTQKLIQMISEAEQSYLPESQKFDLERKLEKEQGEVAVEDDIDLYSEGRRIPIKIADEDHSIILGNYKVSALHFGRMATYLARGGFFGWMNDKKPEFADPTIEAIKSSKRKLYTEIRKELEE